jgi:hypothetical protein
MLDEAETSLARPQRTNTRPGTRKLMRGLVGDQAPANSHLGL